MAKQSRPRRRLKEYPAQIVSLILTFIILAIGLSLLFWWLGKSTDQNPSRLPQFTMDQTAQPEVSANLAQPIDTRFDVARAAEWNPDSKDLITGTDQEYWEFGPRYNPLIVVRQTLDDMKYQDMMLITQELLTAKVDRFEGRNTRIYFQQFSGIPAAEVGEIGMAVQRQKLGGMLSYAMTVRPIGADWHQWIFGGTATPPNVTWTVQGRELPKYVQKVQVQNWETYSNFQDFWSNPHPGYAVITCGGDWTGTTLVVIKQENRPPSDAPFCVPTAVDGWWFVNNSSAAILETDGLLLQEIWEIKQRTIPGQVYYQTTWDNVLGYSHIGYLDPPAPISAMATATIIAPYAP